MFGDPSRMRHLMSSDALKPKRLGETLGRFAAYFGRYWPGLLLVIFLVLGATWTQVINPELIGQAVDCFLTPAAPAPTPGESGPPAGALGTAAAGNCWLGADSVHQGLQHRLLRGAIYQGRESSPIALGPHATSLATVRSHS